MGAARRPKSVLEKLADLVTTYKIAAIFTALVGIAGIVAAYIGYLQLRASQSPAPPLFERNTDQDPAPSLYHFLKDHDGDVVHIRTYFEVCDERCDDPDHRRAVLKDANELLRHPRTRDAYLEVRGKPESYIPTLRLLIYRGEPWIEQQFFGPIEEAGTIRVDGYFTVTGLDPDGETLEWGALVNLLPVSKSRVGR